MSAHAHLEGKSLDDIISESRKNKNGKGARREPKQRDSPLQSSSKGAWKHDKFAEATRKQKPVREPAPQKSEEDLGYKVSVSNCPLTVEELKTLMEGSELKFSRVIPAKKIGLLFFAKKEDADKAVADFNNQELLGENGASVWEYVPWTPREPREPREPRAPKERKEPREQNDRRPRQPKTQDDRRPRANNNGRPQKTAGGSRINANDVVISVRR